VPCGTIYSWRRKWLTDHQWRPWHLANHGLHHWLFTNEEELSLVDEILVHYIAKSKLFNSHTFREIVMRRAREAGLHPNQIRSNALIILLIFSKSDMDYRRGDFTCGDETKREAAPTQRN
jgi:hypothetical protein